MKINSMKTLSLRNDEHYQFHRENVELLRDGNPNTLGVRDLYDEYTKMFNYEDVALKKIDKSDYTRLIKDADHERDNVYGGMVLINKGNAKHWTPEIREAALRIQIPLDTYGNVSRKPLNEQTSAIHNILQDLRGQCLADAETTGIVEWINELERANDVVADLVHRRAQESASKPAIVLKNARTDVDAVYKRIVERINAAVIIEGEPKYEACVNAMNEIIHRYVNAVKVREGRAKKKRAGDSEENEA